ERLARGQTNERGLGELSVKVLGDDQYVIHVGPQMTFASSCRTFTSSGTEPTLRPAARFGGVSSLTVFTRRPTSTPRSATGISFTAFLRAVMMPGGEAQRVWFRRRSAVTTAGSAKESVSRPPSPSRVTVALPSASSTLDANVACGQPSSSASI